MDSNILIDVIVESAFTDRSIAGLLKACEQGVALISDIVYAEICVPFNMREQCDEFLARFHVKVEPLNADSSFVASRNWKKYLKSGGKRLRILPDFLVAAHAANQADRLLTRDRGFYKSHFPGLQIIDPS